MTVVRRLIAWNRRISRWERAQVARLVPGCAPDAMRDFGDRILPGLLKPGARILEVGGGKIPAIPLDTKQRLGLHVVGQDISETELSMAPRGAYDATLVGDIATVPLPGRFDLIFSRAVLEHVADPSAAIANLARALAPGGIMAHVLPCRNAPFAVVNRWMGNRLARRVLFAVFPEKRFDSGFLAYYRDCTPSGLSKACRGSGLEVLQVNPYYNSDYTSFFAPIYTIETMRQAATCLLRAENFAEAFSIIARAPAETTPGSPAPAAG